MIEIKEAEPFEIEEIMKMEYKCFHPEVREKKELFLERMSVFPEGFIVLKESDRYAGYMTSELWEYRKERSRESFGINHSIAEVHDYKGKELYITSFAVNPEFHGKKYGKLMFEMFLEKMMKCYSPKCISLIVAEKWEQAIKIYLKNGFEVVEKFDNFLEDAEIHKNFIFMRKEL